MKTASETLQELMARALEILPPAQRRIVNPFLLLNTKMDETAAHKTIVELREIANSIVEQIDEYLEPVGPDDYSRPDRVGQIYTR